jgi:hypothetical protein
MFVVTDWTNRLVKPLPVLTCMPADWSPEQVAVVPLIVQGSARAGPIAQVASAKTVVASGEAPVRSLGSNLS